MTGGAENGSNDADWGDFGGADDQFGTEDFGLVSAPGIQMHAQGDTC